MRNLHPENIRALGLALNLENWADVYDANDVDDKVQCFNEIIGNMLDTYTPAKRVRMHPNDKEWMTPYIKTQIRARQKAFTKGDKYEYRKLCAKVANLITNAKQRYYENKASSIASLIQGSGLNVFTHYVELKNSPLLHQHIQRKWN